MRRMPMQSVHLILLLPLLLLLTGLPTTTTRQDGLMTAAAAAAETTTSVEDARVRKLVQYWAPLVWLAPDERFLPLGVPEFLDNMKMDEDDYLNTRMDLETLLENRSSFLHGRKPAGNVPIYALLKNCLAVTPEKIHRPTTKRNATRRVLSTSTAANLLADEYTLKAIETNNVPGSSDKSAESSPRIIRRIRRRNGISSNSINHKQRRNNNKLHFHVTYWMFYPFSEGKAVCVLDLGYFGSWPIPSIGGVCFGTLKEYGSHVGDWEHVSLYFKGKDHPLAMYVSAHDSGAFYRYDSSTNIFTYESQETRKGIFQKPVFPERVHLTSENNGKHPVLFSARGSHGLWTAPGRHRFVRLARIYDESGFGEAWPTWKLVEMLSMNNKIMPNWMTFTGKWGNPKSNCHPLARLGFDICEFVDGPTGIPMKKMNFRC